MYFKMKKKFNQLIKKKHGVDSSIALRTFNITFNVYNNRHVDILYVLQNIHKAIAN